MPEPKEPSRAQQLVGDFAPKLAQLTDDGQRLFIICTTMIASGAGAPARRARC